MCAGSAYSASACATSADGSGVASPQLQPDYYQCWQGFKKYYEDNGDQA